MTITLHSSSFSDVMHTLAQGLSAELRQQDGEATIELPAAVGRGALRATRFHDGLSLLLWRVQLNESLTVKVSQTDYHPLRLLLCEAGSLTHSVDARHIQYRLNATDCSLSACSGDVDQIFYLPSHQALSMYMVEIDRRHFLHRIRHADGAIHSRTRAVFEDTEARFPFLYHQYYNHATALVLNQMDRAQQYQGIARDTYLEAKVLELLSLTIHQHSTDQQGNQEGITLREADVQQLLEARNHIETHYIDPPSLQQLAWQVGINEHKLKNGYKQLFHCTVYEHVREERMNQAKALIADGRWDISEVVRMVGYSNTSHFSARFKDTFGLLPKKFQQLAARHRLDGSYDKDDRLMELPGDGQSD